MRLGLIPCCCNVASVTCLFSCFDASMSFLISAEDALSDLLVSLTADVYIVSWYGERGFHFVKDGVLQCRVIDSNGYESIAI